MSSVSLPNPKILTGRSEWVPAVADVASSGDPEVWYAHIFLIEILTRNGSFGETMQANNKTRNLIQEIQRH